MHIHTVLPSYIWIEIHDKGILNVHKKSCTRIHIKILFIIARNYKKKSQIFFKRNYLNQSWYIHAIGCFAIVGGKTSSKSKCSDVESIIK